MPVMVADVSVRAVLWCAVRYLCIILPYAALTVVARLVFPIPREVSRKLLHAAAFVSAPLIMHLAGSWRLAVATMVAIGIVVWPVLAVLEGQRWFSDLFVQRHLHEVRRSLLLLFWGNAAVVAVCWGLFDQPHTARAAILMWGLGDASAALVGKRWGRHHTRLPGADPSKTWEGTAAMCTVSTLVGIVVLLVSGLTLWRAFLYALLTSAVGAYVELVTSGGNDTVTVPTANALVLLLLSML